MNSLEKYNETEAEERMKIIAQNVNNGEHYKTNNKTNEDRKDTPVFSGVLKYFPDALKEVAKCSFVGQLQHNKDKPLAWDRSKSGNEYDSLTRHLIDSAKEDYDTDGTLHKAKIAWRALAGLQKHLEENNSITVTERVIVAKSIKLDNKGHKIL